MLQTSNAASRLFKAMVTVSAIVVLFACLPIDARAQPTRYLTRHDDASRESQSNDNQDFSNDETPPIGNEDTIVSYFIVEYAANFESTADIHRAAKALAVAYNKLITLYDDPYNRRMDVVDGVDILEASVLGDRRRNLVEVYDFSTNTIHTSHNDHTEKNQQLGHERLLQSGARILAILRQRGKSNGCPGNCGYSNDSKRRELGIGYEYDGGSEYPGHDDGDSNDEHDAGDDSDGDADGDSDGDADGDSSDGSSDNSSDGSSDNSNDNSSDHPPLIPGLPSEEAIRLAYSAEVHALGMSNIYAVTALDEVDEPPKGKGTKSSKAANGGDGGKGSNAGKGSDGGKGSNAGKGSDGGKGSNAGKGSSTSKDSNASKDSKSGKGHGNDRSKKASKKSGKSESSKSHKKDDKSRRSLRREANTSTL